MEILIYIIVVTFIMCVLIAILTKKKGPKTLDEIKHTKASDQTTLEKSIPAGQEIKTFNVSDIEAMSLEELSKISKFIAFDFETANDELSSACALGLAFSDGHTVFATRHFYIKPTPNHFEPENIKIHGITPEMVKDAPTFDVINEQLAKLELNAFVAHNLEFDATVWREAFIATLPVDKKPQGKLSQYDKKELINRYGDLPISYACTLKLSRIVYPHLDSYRLDNVCSEIGYDLSNHHNAAADAEATAHIMNDIIDKYSLYVYLYPISNLSDNFPYKEPERMVDIRWMKPFAKSKRMREYTQTHTRISSETLASPDLDAIENKDNPFYDKKVVITGIFDSITREELAIQLKKIGADIQSAVSKKLDYIIVGDEPGWSKMQKVEEYNGADAHIQILTESQIMQMLTENQS